MACHSISGTKPGGTGAGRLDSPLTEPGEWQARRLARAIARHGARSPVIVPHEMLARMLMGRLLGAGLATALGWSQRHQMTTERTMELPADVRRLFEKK